MSETCDALVSIVIPCHNEEQVLPKLRERLEQLWAEEEEVNWECVLVDDGSTDATLEHMLAWHHEDNRVVVVALSRNFGHQNALCAGVEHALGDAVVSMDADLQDPPEVIPAMVARWREGHDIVYARRRSRKGESRFKLLTASLFYRLLRRLSRTSIPMDVGDFRLLSRRAVEALGTLPETSRYLRGLVSWIGFEQAVVEYDRERRLAGESKYGLCRMMALALDAITSFSIAPLRLISYLGIASMLTGFGIAIWAIWAHYVYPDMESGWASLMVAVCVLQGISLFSIGIVGEYIGRVLLETKRRPLYIVRSTHRAGEGPSPDEP